MQVVTQTVENPAFWSYLVQTVGDHFNELREHLDAKGGSTGASTFLM